MGGTSYKMMAMGALLTLLAACGSDERERRPAVSLPQGSNPPASQDVMGGKRDAAAEEALKSCDPASLYVCNVEVAILSYTNTLRVGQGLPPFAFGRKLAVAARSWSGEQAKVNVISHDGFPLAREAVIAAKFGKDHGAKVLGENVALNMMQQDAQQTGKTLATQWWNSPHHKQNILGDFPALGVGVGLRGNRVFATQIFGRETPGQ